ncbi:MAG: gamma-glutamylcyclotransferase family protein [Actinomycetota bacterium]
MAELVGELVGLPVAFAVLAVTALWGAFTYAQSRRNERAEWLHELFTDMYPVDDLTGAKNDLEYRYEDYMAPLLEIRMNDRHVEIGDPEIKTLDRLDNFLNYMEHVLGLQAKGLMTASERRIVFDYWPNIIGRNDAMAALRRYISMSGYERINKELALEDVDYIAVYGSLMRGLSPGHQPEFVRYLEFVAEVLIPGQLYEVVEGNTYRYPGLVLTPSTTGRILHPDRRSSMPAQRAAERRAAAVVGELYRVTDASVFALLDDWEGYDARSPAESPYVRRIVRMIDPAVDAWVYVGNHADRSQVVEHRSWRDHLKSL